ncbi:hypothetical protein OFR22_02915 [Brachyspira hyodysenteriae]|uniref:Uncharacterized protein n=1 Tax=Brachyspira hyodysenteriae ATCC 27164 TaxID=1266923 RepID=A0A3B6W1B3_BRAHO|nr:hypothetical protein [Brachyspira hyodysenteriae]ANN63640.1 hypothetical protein BHYOB78_07095 [Brachyspira hyodysenteriae ATCC 27164]AUJ49987.1 hypothetical protein BH718_01550 [Brachyspira hyodysenteriae]KLI13240.1 hypothetical protein SU45_14165 [Brachyspira hyodysenteriae]KLI19269.1 hypothetical protein SU44_00620 [Brachyspira hyodysenteriae]KLI24004.1 hypothetical protein SR30_08855 [Brachyspira hyodysenteriae]
MNRLSKIIIIFSAFFICSCLNFNTGSVSFNNDGIDSKYYGTYESSITIKENNNFTSQATANVVVSSGSAISIRITGSNINVYSTAYKENIIKISDNVYKVSITSSGNKYDFTLSFNNNSMNLSFYANNNTSGEGNLTKIR